LGERLRFKRVPVRRLYSVFLYLLVFVSVSSLVLLVEIYCPVSSLFSSWLVFGLVLNLVVSLFAGLFAVSGMLVVMTILKRLGLV